MGLQLDYSDGGRLMRQATSRRGVADDPTLQEMAPCRPGVCLGAPDPGAQLLPVLRKTGTRVSPAFPFSDLQGLSRTRDA